MSQINILLAEDDKNLGMILNAYLDAKGYPTTLCVNGEIAYDTFRNGEFDFCIFDIMMPIMDGFTLAKKVREINPRVPIIFLTAKTMQEDILEGFKIGADDYITKPFSMDELLMRIRAVYNRSIASSSSPTSFRLGNFTFDAARHTLANGQKDIKLTSKESDLLLLLCENMGQTLERREALSKIWNEVTQENARSMDVYITKLRKYFKEEPKVELLNVHGVGFKLVTQD
ncbi:MAG: response regulator transcription factor [Bacteroidales bacterium]|nr:response regulator transcription factor [Bacteroidales bacterium]